MFHPDVTQFAGHPTAIGTLTRLAYAKAEAAGVNLGPILRRAHLTLSQVADPATRLRVENQISFLNLVGHEVRDEFLGFHLALAVDPREAGWLYYVVASSPTVGEAFRRGSRYCSMVNEGISLQYSDERDVVAEIEYVGVSRYLDRHQIEFAVALLVRIARNLTGLRIIPTAVRLTHPRTRLPPEIAEFFGGNITFGASVDQVVFDPSVKNLPVLTADGHLNKLLVEYCEQAIGYRVPNRGSFSSQVENALVPVLPHGKVRINEIARQLGLSQRTLARRLSSEGTTFSELLDRLRGDLAKRYLADGGISISEIAWLLGYNEVSSFTHAFRRWTGMSPRQAR
jgi:AraC-like DNA-binding protein